VVVTSSILQIQLLPKLFLMQFFSGIAVYQQVWGASGLEEAGKDGGEAGWRLLGTWNTGLGVVVLLQPGCSWHVLQLSVRACAVLCQTTLDGATP